MIDPCIRILVTNILQCGIQLFFRILCGYTIITSLGGLVVLLYLLLLSAAGSLLIQLFVDLLKIIRVSFVLLLGHGFGGT